MVLDVESDDNATSQNSSLNTSPSSASAGSVPTPEQGSLSSSSIPSQSSRGFNFMHYFSFTGWLLDWLRSRDSWPDGRYDGLEFESIDSYAEGYPQFAAFVNSDDNFRVYRRFGTLRNRILLHRQQELAKLEERLNEIDGVDSREKKHRIQSIRKDQWDQESHRQVLIDEIDRRLEHYDNLLERERRSMSMQKPTKRNYRSIVNYLWNEKPIVRSETAFLNPKDDFIILAKEQDSPFHATLEKMICNSPVKGVKSLFSTEAQKAKTQVLNVRLLDKPRVTYLGRIIVTALAVTLTGIPVCVLFAIPCSNKSKIALVVTFIFLFPAAMTLTARPRNHELFAATATYCAVIVAFLSNFATFSLGQASQPDGPLHL
ncbi:uncharacterized protein K441DRAFT_658679 [Cenococcum geophilum 1.58]|uniref:uncharacterized protein n=1 Tax=Cenococcum geophilum 1.58 TaxID=794803 RepID=UPI00358E91E2|nr:hypothetical protein K441DRAFT_658679 [Cenococcum geophilum 1.58]